MGGMPLRSASAVSSQIGAGPRPPALTRHLIVALYPTDGHVARDARLDGIAAPIQANVSRPCNPGHDSGTDEGDGGGASDSRFVPAAGYKHHRSDIAGPVLF
jgi:hypothetical protein